MFFRWEEEAEKLADNARKRLEEERRKGEKEEIAGRREVERRLSEGQIERRLEERLRAAQVEREARQRELILLVGHFDNDVQRWHFLLLQARKEEQEAIEEGERRSRAKRQVPFFHSLLSPT